MKIALVCPGIGECQRGFERYFSGLFQVLADSKELDITLFKGGGPQSDRERVLRFTRRNGAVCRYLPIHKLFRKTPYYTEGLTYALALLRALRAEPFDIVHTIDPPLASMLHRLRAMFGGRYRLLHTMGCSMPPEYYPAADHMHQVGRMAYDQALAFGYPADDMTLVPCGFQADRFEPNGDRAELRRKHGVAGDAFVILCVGAINRAQKRIDYLIDEVAQLDGNFLLWIDGSSDVADHDSTLFALGRDRLGARCRFTHVPSAQVSELYRLADIKVLASLEESFGLALVEAMCSNLPVLAHDNPHFEWLLQNRDCLVDMSRRGALVERLTALMNDRGRLPSLADPMGVRRRFDWMSITDDYVELYRRVASIER